MKRYVHVVYFVTSQLDVSKVNLDIMKIWIGKEVNEIMGFDDEILIDMIYNMISLEEVIESVVSYSCRKWIQSTFKLLLHHFQIRMPLPLQNVCGTCFFLLRKILQVSQKNLLSNERRNLKSKRYLISIRYYYSKRIQKQKQKQKKHLTRHNRECTYHLNHLILENQNLRRKLLSRCYNGEEIEAEVTVVLEAIQEIVTQDDIIIVVATPVQEVMIDLDIDVILHLQVVVAVAAAIQEISSFLLIGYYYYILCYFSYFHLFCHVGTFLCNANKSAIMPISNKKWRRVPMNR